MFHGQRADGLRVAVVFLDEKFDPERFALFDGEKFKSAGGVAERHHVIGGVVGLIFLVKGVELRVLAAVECFEPGFEGLAGGSIGDGCLGWRCLRLSSGNSRAHPSGREQ